MEIGGVIKFRDKGCFQWVERKEDGMIELLFRGGQDEREVSIAFDPACFKAVFACLGRFVATDEMAENPAATTGEIEPDLDLEFVDDEKVAIKGSWESDALQMISIFNGKTDVSLAFSEQQAADFGDRCRKIADIMRLRRELTTTQIVKARA
jgi:hypothetical protein